MIKRLRIENFRGIREGELELFPLTILLGANNSGKTAVLEALLLAHGPVHRQPYPDIRSVELLRRLHTTLGAWGFSFLLYDYSAKEARITISSDEEAWELPMTREGGEIIVREPPQLGGQEVRLSMRGREILHRYYRDFSKALFIRPDLTKPACQYLRRIWPDVWKHAPEVARALSKLVREDYINFTMEPFHGGEPTLYAFLKDGRRIRLGDLGDGVQVLAVAMLLYELLRPEVLLWDDVEAHMNPSMLLFLASWLAERVAEGTQVVVSTHSIEAVRLIAGAAEELVDDISRICLLSLRDGILRAKVLTIGEVEELKRAGIDVRMGEGFLI